MDDENLKSSMQNKTSKLMGLFSIIFTVIYVVAVLIGKNLPELFLKLLPSFIGGTALTGIVCGILYLKTSNDEDSKAVLGLCISSIGLFASLCLIFIK